MPKLLFTVVGAVLSALAVTPCAGALSAVIEVNEPAWYSGRKVASYDDTNLCRFYAPLPVFFEGWKSEPRDEIMQYTWDFGDGSESSSGFNAAHVYETPGNYIASLTVTDARGHSVTSTLNVEVWQRDGTTYYVDSALGNDANAGTSPGSGAWKTATHAFGGMPASRYSPGDQILFKRGQTFAFAPDSVSVGHWVAKYGYMFGAYGTGDKPVIKATGGSGTLFRFSGVGTAFVAFVDLEFDCTADGQTPSTLVYQPGGGLNFLWLRVDAHNFYDGWSIPSGYDPDGSVMAGLFIVDCTAHMSVVTHIYCTAYRVAILDNEFDFSNNHIAYAENMISGVVSGNSFSRVAYGRTALRISGAGGTKPAASNVWVSKNAFNGWIDPDGSGGAHNGGGTSYNYLLVQFAPNTAPALRLGEWLVFEQNTITDSQILFSLGAWEHVRISNNTFRTPDPTTAKKWQIGHAWDQRPLDDVHIVDNTFEYTGTLAPGFVVPMVWFRNYDGPEYEGRTAHRNVFFSRNIFRSNDTDMRFIGFPAEGEQYAGFISENNLIYSASDSSAMFYQNTEPVTHLTLPQWRSLTGNDLATQIYTNPDWPVPGWAKAPETDTDSPIPVTYDRVEVTSGGALSEVALWARRDNGPWVDTGLRTSGTSGTFSYPVTEGAGTYYLATQAIDSEGNSSLPPIGPGATSTYYTGGAPADTTAPNPGVASAPASTSVSPITVSYTGAADETDGSGLKEVELWVKKASVGTWGPTGLKQTGASGTFSYAVGTSGSETFYFATRAEDNAGNVSPLPSGDGDAATIFSTVPADTIPPTTGAMNVPSVTKTSPIAISYAGVVDEGGSGLKQVVLWAKVNGGSWLSTGMASAQASGTFSYTPAAGDGPYEFALRAEDNAGNLSAVPSGTGAPCLFDATAPSVGAMTSPQYAKATPIQVAYSGVSDGTGSGLKKVYLWFRKDGGAWMDSGLSQSLASGTFSSGPGQNGTYEYAIRTEDNAGNLSPQPSGAGQTATVFDSVVPTLGTLSAPPNESGPPISVVYSGVQDDRSGLKTVHLWFKKGVGTWQDSGLSSTAASGSFPFNGMTGDDTYYFALRADDNAGNLTAVPSGGGAASTVYNTQFNPGTAASPAYAISMPIVVTYSGAMDAASGIKLVRLWYKKGATGTWINPGITSTGESGSFSFSAVSGDDTYYFATQAENNNGDLTPEPPYGDGDTQTVYDTTLPNPGSMASPEYSRQAPILITYTGASDAGSGLKEVRLWYKKGYAGVWTDTGQRSTTPDGSFTFNQVTGDDAYFFFLQAEDKAGHVSAAPSDALVFGGG